MSTAVFMVYRCRWVTEKRFLDEWYYMWPIQYLLGLSFGAAACAKYSKARDVLFSELLYERGLPFRYMVCLLSKWA